jgi:Domain of unknown function (DUF4345)
MRRGLQLALATIGTVAATMGARDLLTGGASVLQGGKVSANVDSELRFRASWYVIFGLLILRAARRPESETTIVRACGAGFFLAACGRLLSIRTVGPPSTVFKLLMGIEFAIPAVIVPWQRAVRGRSAMELSSRA